MADTDASGRAAEPAGDGAGEGEAGPSIGTTASRGFMWANVGVFTRYMSALVLAAVLARVLDDTNYAVMVTLMVVTYYFDNALDLGMGAALVYEQEKGVTDRVRVAFTANVGLTVVLATVALFGSPLIAKYFDLPGYTNLFRCLAVVVVLSGLTVIPWSLFMRGMDFRTRAVVEVARDLTRFGVTIGLAWAGFGAWAVMTGLISAYGVWLVLTLFGDNVGFAPTLDESLDQVFGGVSYVQGAEHGSANLAFHGGALYFCVSFAVAVQGNSFGSKAIKLENAGVEAPVEQVDLGAGVAVAAALLHGETLVAPVFAMFAVNGRKMP